MESPSFKVSASPAVRGIARSQNINLSGVNGSGPGGRVMKEDILRIQDNYEATRVMDDTKDEHAPEDWQERHSCGHATLVPLSGSRRVMARRMEQANKVGKDINAYFLVVQLATHTASAGASSAAERGSAAGPLAADEVLHRPRPFCAPSGQAPRHTDQGTAHATLY